MLNPIHAFATNDLLLIYLLNQHQAALLQAIPTEIILSWFISIPVALVIRGLVKGTVPPTPFIIVSLISTYTLLFLWRTIYIYAFATIIQFALCYHNMLKQHKSIFISYVFD